MQRREIWCCQKGIDVCGVARACAYDVLKFYGILKSGAESSCSLSNLVEP
jgi:hypothetical protein